MNGTRSESYMYYKCVNGKRIYIKILYKNSSACYTCDEIHVTNDRIFFKRYNRNIGFLFHVCSVIRKCQYDAIKEL